MLLHCRRYLFSSRETVSWKSAIFFVENLLTKDTIVILHGDDVVENGPDTLITESDERIAMI
jgi:hypothetical protein